MNLPRSTYYHQSKNHSVDDGELIAQIEAIIEDFPGYGYRRVTRELHRRGIPVNHKKVLRIMRQRGLLRKTKRRWISLKTLLLQRPTRSGRQTSPILASEMVSSTWRSFWTYLPGEPSGMPFPAT
jgi:putative transposase